MEKIKQHVILAKTGDKESFNYLVRYYTPIFCDKVTTKFGERYKKEAKEKIEEIIKYYFDNNINSHISFYIYRKANNFVKEKKTLKELIVTDKRKVAEHYSHKIYELLKNKKGILTKGELEKFCFDFLMSKIDNFINEEKFHTRLILIVSNMNKKISNEEDLLIEYIKYEGLNDKILSYIVNKYKYILNGNKYKIYEKEFDKIIIECLEKRYSQAFSTQAFSKFLESYIKEKYNEDRNKARELLKKDQLNNDEMIFIKDVYSYYKDIFFERYRGIVNDEVLKQIIDKKYNYFIDSYLKGPKSRELSQSLNDKMTMFFSGNAYLETIKNEDSSYLIERYKEKYDCYYPIEDELLKVYKESVINYYTKKRKVSFHEYVRTKLIAAAKELRKYDKKYIDDTTNNFKQKSTNIIDEEIKEEVINGLKNYYLENKIYEKELYDRYLFNELLNYDVKIYKEIFEFKKYNSNKVLKRHI